MSTSIFEEIMADPACRVAPVTKRPKPAAPSNVTEIKTARAARKPPAAEQSAPPGDSHSKKTWQPVFFHDHASDTPHGGIFDTAARKFVSGFAPSPRGSLNSAKQLITFCGGSADGFQLSAIPAGEFRFEPGNDEACRFRADGLVQVNSWREPEIRHDATPSTSVPQTIARIITHALGEEMPAVERFLNWLAFIYQTHQRANTAWILSGDEGTGKGLLFDKILGPVFGPLYCKSLVSHALAGEFNAELDRCIFLNVNECSAKGWEGTGINDTVKTLIADETLRVHAKGKDARFVPNYLNLLLYSNKTKVAELPPGDRRYNVATPQLKRLDLSWPGWNWEQVKADIKSELPAFCGYLKQYKVDATLAATAFMSAAKEEMIANSATSAEEFVHALRKGDLNYFIRSYFDLRDAQEITALAFGKIVQAWLAGAGSEQRIRAGVLCTAYNALFGGKSPMHVSQFGKFLSNNRMKALQDRHGSYLSISFKAPADIAEIRASLPDVPRDTPKRDPFET